MPAKTDEFTARLLQEGSCFYLQAATALAVFENEVQKRCQQVLADHLDDLSICALAMRPGLAESEIKPRVYGPGQDYRSVGVEIVRKGVPVGIRYWGFYCLLCWDAGTADPYVNICEWLGPRSFAEALGRQFQKLNDAVWREGKEIGLSSEYLKIEAAGDLDKNLESVLRQWIALRAQVGGMKGAFKKTSEG